MIEVLATGLSTTVQDLGRYGCAHLGVSRSGAADRGALVRANRLVGNPVGAAGLEITFGGLAVRFVDAATVALTGAPCRGGDVDVALTLRAGTVLRLAVPTVGARSYLAVRGGVEVPAVLGSRSTDTLSGLGPAPLQSGDLLPVGDLAVGDVSGEVAVPPTPAPLLRVVRGPRMDWFTRNAPQVLAASSWTVRPESSRVGLRLDGPVLVRIRSEELPSEPTLPGALQVPPDGRPILLGPDAPVTGGYPVIGVVRAADLDAAAQLRPGDQLRFVLCP